MRDKPSMPARPNKPTLVSDKRKKRWRRLRWRKLFHALHEMLIEITLTWVMVEHIIRFLQLPACRG
jgi:hypothetical protein